MISFPSISLPRENHLDNLNYRESYLAAFSDYSANHLTGRPPEKAAEFAAQYASAYILLSSIIEKMDGKLSASKIIDIHNKIKEARGNIESYNDDNFTLGDLWAVADKAARFRTGNCGELCAVGARALMEFGYQGKVEVAAIIGYTADGAYSNHALMIIHGSEGEDSWVADPMTALMTPEQREKFLGDKNITSLAKQAESFKIIHPYLEKDGNITCPPLNILQQEPGIKILSCYVLERIYGEISLTHLKGEG